MIADRFMQPFRSVGQRIAQYRLRRISDWARMHRLGSVQLAGGFAVLFGIGPDLLRTWAFMPDDLKNSLPHGAGRWVAVAAFLLTLLGRVFRLERKDEHDEH